MAKIVLALTLLFALLAFASAQGGVKDILGNYYDFTTGQYSSSLTGRVYNSVPAAVPVHSYVSHYAAPAVYGAYPAVYGVSPFLYK